MPRLRKDSRPKEEVAPHTSKRQQDFALPDLRRLQQRGNGVTHFYATTVRVPSDQKEEPGAGVQMARVFATESKLPPN
jgi:hypothetical protein